MDACGRRRLLDGAQHMIDTCYKHAEGMVAQTQYSTFISTPRIRTPPAGRGGAEQNTAKTCLPAVPAEYVFKALHGH